MEFSKIILCGLLLGAAGTDLAWRRIPNGLICSGLAAFLTMAARQCLLRDMAGLIGCMAAGTLAFALHWIPYLRKSMGAGDVKLALVTGLLLGWEDWLKYLEVFCIFSLIVSGALWILRKDRTVTLPLAPVMAAACIACQLMDIV
ncbi:MAG: prepilin peptidase [Clostridiales bacterium]|nr:prepilin peptidase [Clostridiales bacterium]